MVLGTPLNVVFRVICNSKLCNYQQVCSLEKTVDGVVDVFVHQQSFILFKT